MSASYPMLGAIFAEFEKKSTGGIVGAIHSEFIRGDIKEALTAVAVCVMNKQAYYADRIYACMKVIVVLSLLLLLLFLYL